MDVELHLAGVASAIADQARARMLCALMDARARTATELAAVAGVAPSTASSHLQRLEQAGLIQCTRSGKHRYFRLTGENVAGALESLLCLSGDRLPAFRPSTPDHLRFARTCYDHAAGECAVQLHDWLLESKWIVPAGDGYVVSGESLAAWGVVVESGRRRFAYPCLDWSERRHHLGGALGAGVLCALEKKGWVRREAGSRALEVTRSGKMGFARLGLEIGENKAASW